MNAAHDQNEHCFDRIPRFYDYKRHDVIPPLGARKAPAAINLIEVYLHEAQRANVLADTTNDTSLADNMISLYLFMVHTQICPQQALVCVQTLKSDE